MEQVKRTRGGQIGNHNALKHGYYSRIFSEEEKADICSAGEVQGLDEEIALIRHVIKEAASFKDEKHQMLVVRAAGALNKLMRTRHKLQPNHDLLKNALLTVYRDIAAPLGYTREQFFHQEKWSLEENKNESAAEPAPVETKNEYPEAVQL